MDKLQVIIPVYNEGASITKTLIDIRDKIAVPCEIIIVYDHDEDNTIPIVKEYMETANNPFILLVKNQYGMGGLNAIKTGFNIAKSDIILIVMADCSDDLLIVDKMCSKINEGYDIVSASRYMAGGKQIGGGRIKKLLSWLAGATLYYLVGIPTHDITNNFKMYKKSVIDNIFIESNGGFEVAMEIVIKAYFMGCKITEIPTTWRDRTGGKSRFKLIHWLPKYIRWYLFAIRNKWFNPRISRRGHL